MTPGNNGASTPEDDDPFGYLYADGQANGAQPPSGGYGYPGSVSRVRAVGERQYGQPQQQTAQYGQYGQPPTVPQQGAYGQPNANYAAPETFPGGAPTGRQQAHGGGGRGRGPNTKGLLIGAVAVVAAVVIGIAVAMANGDDGADDNNKASDQVSTSASASASASPSESSTGEAGAEELPTIDAKALKLGGGATLASDVQGAQADGGIYVGNLNNTGASVTWNVNGIPEDGTYTLYAHYSAAGDDQAMTLTINGKVFGSKFNMKNYTGAEDGDFAKGWTTTYSYPSLTKGTNTITLSCENGDKCNVLLDQLYLKAGKQN
ncbi:carbohydrate-binding protein [Streptomyces sp. NPDC096132]|uniref:carbohydrate-binding protein n=1 Tax=Streptomyces sp. NPDC096132 TaxID=3366075 RepID=UPI0038186DF3